MENFPIFVISFIKENDLGMPKFWSNIQNYCSMEVNYNFPPLSLPKSRASKILQFKHYQTDAPV